MAPSGKGGTETSATKEKKSVAYRTFGGGIYTPPSSGGGGTSYVEPAISTDVKLTREYAATAKSVTAEAARRGVDISTPVRERGFINVLTKEGKGSFAPKEDEKKGKEMFIGGLGYSVPSGMEGAFQQSVMGNVSSPKFDLTGNLPKFNFTEYAKEYGVTPSSSSTWLGNIQTAGEFETSRIYENLSGQVESFKGLTDEQKLAMSFDVSSGVYGTSTAEGISLSFTPNLNMAKQYAKESYSQLPTIEKIKLTGADIGFGLGKFATGVVGFTGDVLSLAGTRTLKTGEDFRIFDTSNFGGTERAMEKIPIVGRGFADITNTQIGTAGTIAEIGATVGLLAYGGIKGLGSFKLLKGELGTSGAVMETLGSFSPLRPIPNIYAIKIPKNADVKALSFMEEGGGFTARNIIGKGEGFDLYSKQISKELTGGISFGKSETIIEQPAFIVGGGNIKPGLIVSKSEGFIGSPENIGKVLATKGFGEMKVSALFKESFTGGISQSFTRPTYTGLLRKTPKGLKFSGEYFNPNYLKVGRGGGYSSRINDALSEFGFGKRFRIPKITREQDYFLIENSGKFKIKPNIKGYEVDLNKALNFNAEEATGMNIFRGGGKKTPLSKTFAPQQTIQMPKIESNLKTPLSKTLNAQLENIQGSLKFATPKINLKTSMRMLAIPNLKSEQKQGIMSKSFMVQPQVNFQNQFQRQFQGLGQLSRTIDILGLKEKTGLINIQIPAQAEVQLFKENQQLKNVFKIPNKIRTPQPITDFIPFEFVPPSIPPPFILPPLLGQEGGRRKKKKGSRGFVKTPTLYNVLGKELNFKPISTGFENPFKKGVKLPTTMAFSKGKQRYVYPSIEFSDPFSPTKKRRKKKK